MLIRKEKIELIQFRKTESNQKKGNNQLPLRH